MPYGRGVQLPEPAVTAALESHHGQVIMPGRQPGQDVRAAGLKQAADRKVRIRPGSITGHPE